MNGFESSIALPPLSPDYLEFGQQRQDSCGILPWSQHLIAPVCHLFPVQKSSCTEACVSSPRATINTEESNSRVEVSSADTFVCPNASHQSTLSLLRSCKIPSTKTAEGEYTVPENLFFYSGLTESAWFSSSSVTCVTCFEYSDFGVVKS